MKCFRCGSDYTLNKSKFPCGDCRRLESKARRGKAPGWLSTEQLGFAIPLGRIGQAVAEGESLRTLLQQMRAGVGMPKIARLVRAPDATKERREAGGGKTRIWYLFDITGQLADQMITDEQAYALASTEDAIIRWPRGRRWASGEMLSPKKSSGGDLTPFRPRRPRSPRPSPPGVDTAA